MAAKPKAPRYQGRWLASWQADIREEMGDQRRVILAQLSESLAKLRTDINTNAQAIRSLNEKLGTSTPLIIWNIAVLIAIAGLGAAVAKLYGVVPY